MLRHVHRGVQSLRVGALAPARVHTAVPTALPKESTSSPPTPPEEAGSEKKLRFGVNTPSSAGEFASEAASATSGLAQSVATTARAAATGIKLKLGLTDDKPMGNPPTALHGAGGKMEHAPLNEQGLGPGGPAASRAHAEAKYQEIAYVEKPHFPEGEKSVQDQFPSAAEAAKLQVRIDIKYMIKRST